MERLRGGFNSWLKPVLIAAVFIALLVMPAPAGLPPQGQRVLAVAAAAILLWITELLPLAVTALLAVVLLAATGSVSTTADAFYGFSHPIVYFFLGVLTLSQGVIHTGLAERAAYYIIARSRGRGRTLYTHLVASFALLAFILPSATTRGGILIPTYERALGLVGVARGAPLARAVMLALGVLNRIGSTALLTGGIAPIAAAALLGGFSWSRWFLMMAVPEYSLLALGGLTIYLLHCPARVSWPVPELVPAHHSPLSRSQLRMIAIAIGVSLLWLTDSLHHWHPALPALMAAILILSPRLGVLDWHSFERSFPWSNIFVMAAALSLAQALNSSGAAAWFAKGLVGGLSSLSTSPLLLVALLIGVAHLVRLVMPGMAAYLALVIPVVLAFGQQVGLNPLLLGLIVTIAADSVVMYIAYSPSAIMAHHMGHFTGQDVFKVGLVMTGLSYAVIFLVAIPYWALLGERLVP